MTLVWRFTDCRSNNNVSNQNILGDVKDRQGGIYNSSGHSHYIHWFHFVFVTFACIPLHICCIQVEDLTDRKNILKLTSRNWRTNMFYLFYIFPKLIVQVHTMLPTISP